MSGTRTASRTSTGDVRRPSAVRALYSGNARAVLGRELLAARRTTWTVILSGFFEPVFYLVAMGRGLGAFIGDVTLPSGQVISYAAYIAPALLAVSAMNGAVYDSTWNVFFKMNVGGRLFQSMLTTSIGPLDVALGEIGFALLRGGAYAAAFLVIMEAFGLVLSPWALLTVPTVLLVAFGFASIGMAVTSYLKTIQQMDVIQTVMLPMFLFSATFYPISVYPEPVQWIVKAFPLWHAVELIRGLTTGAVSGAMLGHLAYFVVMIGLGITFAATRLRALFLD